MFVLCAIFPNLCHNIFNTLSSLQVIVQKFIPPSELQSQNLIHGCPGRWLSKPVLANNRSRIYMVLCGYCRINVKPKMYSTWKGLIHGLGVFYLIYIITKVPHCPNCNFPMPRRSMVFAFHPPQQLIKLARMSILQLVHLKDRVTAKLDN